MDSTGSPRRGTPIKKTPISIQSPKKGKSRIIIPIVTEHPPSPEEDEFAHHHSILISGGPSLMLIDNSGVGEQHEEESGLTKESNGENNGSESNAENSGGISSPETTIPPYIGIIQGPISLLDGQSLKHLSVSAPTIRSSIRSSGSDSDFILAPSSSKSRQKKFHRHFKTVSQEEKVLDYYSCALQGDILLQGFLYLTENHFAFYSNVFGYVTKLLIPVSDVVRITKEKTAKIIPNAVGISTKTEKYVFASFISRDTTYKLMCKVWNYSIDQEAKDVRKITEILKEEDKCELSVPDESSGESGSGNESNLEHSSPPSVVKLLHSAKMISSVIPSAPSSIRTSSASNLGNSSVGIMTSVNPSLNYSRIAHRAPGSQSTIGLSHLNSSSVGALKSNTFLASKKIDELKNSNSKSTSRFPPLLLLATFLLVILFLSATILLSRISSLQNKISSKPTFHDSDHFYEELLSWQSKLHTSSADEIHQYINVNLQQIVRVRQSLEALSLLFMSSQGDGSSSKLMSDPGGYGNDKQ